MPAQPLTPEQKADALRLKEIFSREKKQLGLTQESLADACGWSSQGTVSQYLNAKIPLNLEAALRFAAVLECKVADFSPRLAATLSLASAHGDGKEKISTRPASTIEVNQAPTQPKAPLPDAEDVAARAMQLAAAWIKLPAHEQEQVWRQVMGTSPQANAAAMPPVESSEFLPAVPAPTFRIKT